MIKTLKCQFSQRICVVASDYMPNVMGLHLAELDIADIIGRLKSVVVIWRNTVLSHVMIVGVA